MTARPLRIPRPAGGLRVVQGRTIRKPVVAPWMAFTLVVVVAFVGLAIARTAMDQGAFELAELDRRIAVEETRNQHLRLDVSRLESPARIGPLAEEMGLVYPEDRVLVVVRGVAGPGPDEDPRWAAIDRYAAAAPAIEGPDAPAAETPETP